MAILEEVFEWRRATYRLEPVSYLLEYADAEAAKLSSVDDDFERSCKRIQIRHAVDHADRIGKGRGRSRYGSAYVLVRCTPPQPYRLPTANLAAFMLSLYDKNLAAGIDLPMEQTALEFANQYGFLKDDAGPVSPEDQVWEDLYWWGFLIKSLHSYRELCRHHSNLSGAGMEGKELSIAWVSLGLRWSSSTAAPKVVFQPQDLAAVI